MILCLLLIDFYYLFVGSQILSGSKDMTSKIFDLSTGQVLQKKIYTSPINSVAISKQFLNLVSTHEDSIIYKLGFKNVEQKYSVKNSLIQKSVFSKCGNFLVVSTDLKTTLIDIEKKKEIPLEGLKGSVIKSMSLNSPWIVVSSLSGNQIILQHITGLMITKIYEKLENPITSVAVDLEGNIQTGYQDGSLKMQSNEGQIKDEVKIISVHTRTINSIAIGIDKIVAGSLDGYIFVYSKQLCELLQKKNLYTPITSIDMGLSKIYAILNTESINRFAIIGLADGRILVQDLCLNYIKLTINDHTDEVTSVSLYLNS